MDVDQAGVNIAAHGMRLKHRFQCGKRIIKGAFHENLPESLRHQHFAPARGLKHLCAFAGGRFGKVERANDPRFGFAKLDHVFLIERMIAQRQNVRARIK